MAKNTDLSDAVAVAYSVIVSIPSRKDAKAEWIEEAFGDLPVQRTTIDSCASS